MATTFIQRRRAVDSKYPLYIHDEGDENEKIYKTCYQEARRTEISYI